MGQRYLVDSNVIIDYSSLRLPENSNPFVENIFNNEFLVSVIVKIEILGFDDAPEKRQNLEKFIANGILLQLDEQITEQTIFLRRKYKKLKLGDAIIAATAMVNNLTLVSRNIKDFDKIEGLNLIDPYSI